MAKKVGRARARKRVNTAANLTDAEIKARNEQAKRAFAAARASAKRGFDQSKTKIRTTSGKDGKVTTSIRGSGGADKRNAAAARAAAVKRGVIPKTEKKQPFVSGRISRRTSGMPNTDAYSTQARGHGRKSTARGSGSKKTTKKTKSLSEIKSFLTGLQVALKHGGHGEASTEARVAGTNVGTKIRNTPQADKIRDKPKEVKTGKQYNLQTRLGDIATRGVRTSASELPTLAGELLKSFKAKWN